MSKYIIVKESKIKLQNEEDPLDRKEIGAIDLNKFKKLLKTFIYEVVDLDDVEWKNKNNTLILNLESSTINLLHFSNFIYQTKPENYEFIKTVNYCIVKLIWHV